jgi:hypothetical protein
MKWNMSASKVIKLFKLDRTESGLRNRKKTLLEKFARGKVPPDHEYYAEVEESADPRKGVARTVPSSHAIAQLDKDRPNEVDGGGALIDEGVNLLEEAREGGMQRPASPQVVIPPPDEDQDEGGVDDIVDELYAVSVDGNVQEKPGPVSPIATKQSRASCRHRRRDTMKEKRRSETSRASSSLANNLPGPETGVAPFNPPNPEPEAMHTQENGDESPPSQSGPIVTEPCDLRTPLTEPDANGGIIIGRPGYPVRIAVDSVWTDEYMWDMAMKISKQRLGLAKTQYEYDWLSYQVYIAMTGNDQDELARLKKKTKPLLKFLQAKQAGKVDMNANIADWVPDRTQHDGSVDEEFDREDGSGDEEYGSDYGEYYDAEEEYGAVLPDEEEYPHGVEREREFEEVEDEEPSNTARAARNTTLAATNGPATNGPANPFGLTPSRLDYQIPPGPRRPPPPPGPARLPYSDNDTESSNSSESGEEDGV